MAFVAITTKLFKLSARFHYVTTIEKLMFLKKILLSCVSLFTTFSALSMQQPTAPTTQTLPLPVTRDKMKLPVYIAVVLVKDNKYFLIERKNTDWAQGFWNFPGGLVEPNQTILQGAIRETHEEVGITVKPEDFEQVHMIHVHKSATNTQDILGIYFKATTWSGTPHNAEPEKIANAG